MALPCAFILKRFQAPPGGGGGAEERERPARRDLAFSGTVYEIALVVMSAYMSYITAEVGSCAQLWLGRKGLVKGLEVFALVGRGL